MRRWRIAGWLRQGAGWAYVALPAVLLCAMTCLTIFIAEDYFRPAPYDNIWRSHWAGCGDFRKVDIGREGGQDYLALEITDKDTGQFLIAGGADTVAETARVAEVGYRAQPMPTLSYSATLFYTDFERLRSLEPATPGIRLPYVINSLGKGNLRGIEFWASWQAARGWRLHAGGVLQDVDMGREPASRDTTGLSGLGGNDPNLTWTLRSAHDLSERIWADFSLRYVARLPQLAVPSYHELDARIAWQVLSLIHI